MISRLQLLLFVITTTVVVVLGQFDPQGLATISYVTNTTQYPYFAFSAGTHLCGATIIWEDVLIAAAHCAGAFVENGVYIGGTTDDGQYSIRYDVQLEMPHPLYNPTTSSNDIMLIKLVRYAPGPFAVLNFNTSIPAPNTTVTSIGFGNNEADTRLMSLDSPTVAYGECRKTWGVRVEDAVMICTGGTPDLNVCLDGPVFEATTGTQIGIASYGKGCNITTPGPIINARISNYASWIQSGICTLTQSPKKPSYCYPPTSAPVPVPTSAPVTTTPTLQPVSGVPTKAPLAPTSTPTLYAPTHTPTTKAPTHSPVTHTPTHSPITHTPVSYTPTHTPVTKLPTKAPSKAPILTKTPTLAPVAKVPTEAPTLAPVAKVPTEAPTKAFLGSDVPSGSYYPSLSATYLLSDALTLSDYPSLSATSLYPSLSAFSDSPSLVGTSRYPSTPSSSSDAPSSVPSDIPSSVPSDIPSSVPSDIPSSLPSAAPSSIPSSAPVTKPPSLRPTWIPTTSTPVAPIAPITLAPVRNNKRTANRQCAARGNRCSHNDDCCGDGLMECREGKNWVLRWLWLGMQTCQVIDDTP